MNYKIIYYKITDFFKSKYNPSLGHLKEKKDGRRFFIEGFISAFDISGNFLMEKIDCGRISVNPLDNASPWKSDADALASDWKKVGRDLERVLKKID